MTVASRTRALCGRRSPATLASLRPDPVALLRRALREHLPVEVADEGRERGAIRGRLDPALIERVEPAKMTPGDLDPDRAIEHHANVGPRRATSRDTRSPRGE